MLITEAEKDLSCVLFFFFQPKTFIQCVYKILWHIYGCNIELESKADLRDDYLNPFGSVGDDERLQKVLFFFSATECGVDFLVYRNLCLLCAWGLR